MRKEYDFGKMKSRRNPYFKRLTRSVSLRMDRSTIAYFEALAIELGIPCKSLMSLYLRNCAYEKKKLSIKWG